MPRQKSRIPISTVVILIATVLLLSGLSGLYVHFLSDNLAGETYVYLQEIAQQSRDILRKQIEEDITTLQDLSFFIISHKDSAQELVLQNLRAVAANHDFKRMGIIELDGSVMTTDEAEMNLADRPYFSSALNGKSSLSDTIIDRTDGNLINVYSIPLYRNNEVIGAVFATHSNEVYKSILSVSTFQGNGYSYIVKSTGETIALSDHPNSVKSLGLLDGKMDERCKYLSEGGREKMMENMKHGESGILIYEKDGIKKYMSYVPVEINDWYLISVVPASVASERTAYVQMNTLWVCLGVVIVFALLLAYNLFMQNKARRELFNLAFTDSLTGACNLNKFRQDALDIIKKAEDNRFAVIRFDVEKFKFVNNVYGYETGNRLLQHIVRVFCKHLKENERIARLYNDEFTVLMHFSDREDLIRRLEQITGEIEQFKNQISGNFDLTISYGVHKLIDQKDPKDISDMMDKANLAHKLGKGRHSTEINFYRDTLYDDMVREKEIENSMKSALKNREFEVYLQPKIDLDTGKVSGAEALTRWNHPQKGLLYPGEFIPVFEKNGFVADLDIFVFEEVCKLLSGWIKEGLPVVPVSVNVSRHLLENVDFTGIYVNLLKRYQVPVNLIELELTETVVFENVEYIVDVLNRLKENGFVLSMDDFGSGYSSLNLLKEIPVDVLKLDRGFFKEIMNNDRGKKIVNGVIRLAKSIGIKVVAEGVETPQQSDFLRQVGCDMAQGYLFAKPMPIRQFEALLRGAE